MPHVVVLMATFNGEKHIAEQLDSILGQKAVTVTVYVRDDHSADTTTVIVERYSRQYANVILLSSLPQRMRVTRNFYSIVRDIEMVPFDYMAYADQDDIWLPDKLSAAIYSIKGSGSNCYASNLLRADENGNIIKERSVLKRCISYLFNSKSARQTRYDHYFEAASAGCTLVLDKTATVYFQERVQQIYDQLPGDTSHDWSTYAITRIGGFTWTIDTGSYIIYRQHADNAYGANLGRGGIGKLLEWFTSGRYLMHIRMIDSLYNNTGLHPPFMKAVNGYKRSSLLSRIRLALAVSGYRRKLIHRVLLFGLIVMGYLK